MGRLSRFRFGFIVRFKFRLKFGFRSVLTYALTCELRSAVSVPYWSPRLPPLPEVSDILPKTGCMAGEGGAETEDSSTVRRAPPLVGGVSPTLLLLMWLRMLSGTWPTLEVRFTRIPAGP